MIPTYDQCMQQVSLNLVTVREYACYQIFNYGKELQFDNSLWNETNRWCRGIIFDDQKRLVALPFKKFFNVDQVEETSIKRLQLLGDPIRIATKADGSLGILFWDKKDNDLRIATRGSFLSDQAVWATRWIRQFDNDTAFIEHVRNGDFTYLFEIIFPENRIVVDYEGTEALVPLGRVNKRTGQVDYEFGYLPPYLMSGIQFACENPIVEIDRLMKDRGKYDHNHEGWVLTYADGTMVKIKCDEYLKIHRLISGLTLKRVWEAAVAGVDVRTAMEGLPDEFLDEALRIEASLYAEFAKSIVGFFDRLATCPHEIKSAERKEQALWAKATFQPHELSWFFAILDRKNVNQLIWKKVLDSVTKGVNGDECLVIID